MQISYMYFNSKYKYIFLKVTIFFSIIVFTGNCNGQNISDEPSNFTDLNQIKVSNWLHGANSALSFTFDDSNPAHKDIAAILENNGFYGSFFASPGKGNWDTLGIKYREIVSHGHEVGSHGWSHLKLTTLPVDSIVSEVIDPINFIYEKTGVRPVSFVHPHNSTNVFIDSIVFRNYLFSRISSLYSMNNRMLTTIYSYSSISDVFSLIEKSVKSKKWLIIAGHGLNNSGWEPITAEFLNEICNNIKSYKSNIWVGTLAEIGTYDYLRNEIKIESSFYNDGIEIKVKNLDQNKYPNISKLPISIVIPVFSDITISSDSINPFPIKIEYRNDFHDYIVTFDLKETQDIHLKVKNLIVVVLTKPTSSGSVIGPGKYDYGQTVELQAIPNHGYSFIDWIEKGNIVSADSIYSFKIDQNRAFEANFKETNGIATLCFPNPASGTLLINGDNNNSIIKIFDLNGKLIMISGIVDNRIDVNNLNSGYYIIQIDNESVRRNSKILIQ
jgi:peptidoglycan/xylan/chitin deacetylase (PgdA/CDA1 family)